MACKVVIGGIGITECPVLTFDSDALFQFLDALNEADVPPSPIEGATVTVEFFDTADDSLIHGPIAMSEFPISPSNDYQVTVFIGASNGFAIGQIVKVVMFLDGGIGLKATRSVTVAVLGL